LPIPSDETIEEVLSGLSPEAFFLFREKKWKKIFVDETEKKPYNKEDSVETLLLEGTGS